MDKLVRLLALWIWLVGSGAVARPLRVVVTVAPLYEFTQKVAGAQAEVRLLIQPGTEIHDYQARPFDILQLREAQVLVQNGLGLEGFVTGLLRNAESDLLVIDTSRGITPLTEESEHFNPHIWLDPHRAQQQVRNIRDGLIQADPQHRQAYQANAEAYLSQLKQLDREFRARLHSHTGQSYVCLNNAFSYFAQRYGLRQITILPANGALLTPRSLQATLARIQALGVNLVLSTTSGDSRVLDLIKGDLGVMVGVLNTLETPAPQGYLATMHRNLQILKLGLTGLGSKQ